jgi:hypothetical protein
MAGREIRRVQLRAGTIPLGALAATDVRHTRVPDAHTGSMCLACFGWRDDPRHISGRGGATWRR